MRTLFTIVVLAATVIQVLNACKSSQVVEVEPTVRVPTKEEVDAGISR